MTGSLSDRHRYQHDHSIVGEGRQRLLDTALRLFDEQGIDAVSARTITAKAGHRNAAAVNYHFGTLEELILALLDEPARQIDERRHAALDAAVEAGTLDLFSVVHATLTPPVERLENLEGRRYVRLLAHLANHPRYHHRARFSFSSSLLRAGGLMTLALGDIPDRIKAQRMQLVFGTSVYALAEQARLLDTDPPPRPPLSSAEFLAELTATICAILSAPPGVTDPS